ncbi:hypothetical protein P692DRAFT_20829017 [Suillus brevipes Sb2]|nr:hypothetical protein P692DRAFT_20829017 [Suillus brevipes Sb2]
MVDIHSTKGYIQRSPFAPSPLSLTSDGVTNPLSLSFSPSNAPLKSSTKSTFPIPNPSRSVGGILHASSAQVTPQDSTPPELSARVSAEVPLHRRCKNSPKDCPRHSELSSTMLASENLHRAWVQD